MEVSGSGGGFRDVDPKDVFDKFARSNNSGNKGSGLGLSIVKGFTEALGGTVALKNTRGVGAVFTIFLRVKISDFSTVVT